ncbi:nickel ABC transporter permease [Desulfitibacter alkalitolerans]|uniref:nickel ABC transporter permease n=1 Tax=Desulfitibacter alkalitolerans TaxID=264641 RepID=UPI00048A3C88|nr:nickel ABC transporter permease [Desulfitibacter alkalitolerans]
MRAYILQRLLYLIPVFFGVSLLTYSLSKLAPGDPAEIKLRQAGFEPTQQMLEATRQQMGLNDPEYVQFLNWLSGVLKGDLGVSFYSGTPVTQEILYRLPATFELTFAALIVMIAIAMPVGVLAAVYKGTWVDNISRVFAFLGASMPAFWLGLILMYYLSVKYTIFPVMGRHGIDSLVLPAVTLGMGMAATYTRLLRASILEVLGQDYIMAARARGLKERIVIVNHALKNALISIVTLLGMSLGFLLGGTVIVETVFSWPGVGKYAVEAIFNRDYPVIQGYVLWMAVIFVLANLLVDISYRFLDPRIRLGRGS